ncbi:MAG: 30S ribosomal protein S6 [Deltaproteobacteria bacterium]|nr:30S ribosomal protein S6 [Deltaproteobacteria bacterium]
MIGYETTYILRADVSDEVQKTFLEKLKGIITTAGGQVIAVEDWGRRRLAYPIQKENRGYYTYLLYTGNNALVAELERNLRINEQALRFLSVKLEDDFDPATFKRRPSPNLAPTVGVTPVTPVGAPVEERKEVTHG